LLWLSLASWLVLAGDLSLEQQGTEQKKLVGIWSVD
jgi:hypothetical protein